MSLTPLLLVLSFFASLKAQQQPYAGPFTGQAGNEPCELEDGDQVVLPRGGCDALRRAQSVLERLRGPARMGPGDLRLDVRVWDKLPTAAFQLDAISVTWPLLRDFGSDEGVLTVLLSHEAGHALQSRHGVWPDFAAKGFTARQMEAQADLEGVALAAKAGFAGQAWLSALERFLEHPAAAAAARQGGDSHPSIDIRRANIVYFLSQGAREAPGPRAFEADGRLSR